MIPVVAVVLFLFKGNLKLFCCYILAFHDVSVYPKKELPFFILFTAGLCSFTALLALLTHQYPEPMGVIAKTVSDQTTDVVFMKGLSRVLGLTFANKYSQVQPKIWLKPFMNMAPHPHRDCLHSM